MTTYPMRNMTGTPIRQSYEQLYTMLYTKTVRKIAQRYDIPVEQAEDRAQNAWLYLYERLMRDPHFLVGRHFGFVVSHIVLRAYHYHDMRLNQREQNTTDDMLSIKAAKRQNKSHDASFTHIADFWIDYSRAAQIIARQHQHSTVLTWALYLTVTGRLPETQKYHDKPSRRARRQGEYTKWCPHTRTAFQQIAGCSQETVRKARRLIQSELAQQMADWNYY